MSNRTDHVLLQYNSIVFDRYLTDKEPLLKSRNNRADHSRISRYNATRKTTCFIGVELIKNNYRVAYFCGEAIIYSQSLNRKRIIQWCTFLCTFWLIAVLRLLFSCNDLRVGEWNATHNEYRSFSVADVCLYLWWSCPHCLAKNDPISPAIFASAVGSDWYLVTWEPSLAYLIWPSLAWYAAGVSCFIWSL